jgi:hypothetical protein
MYGRPTRRMYSTVAFIRAYLDVPEPNMRSFDEVSEFITQNLFEANVAKYMKDSTPRSSSFRPPLPSVSCGLEDEDVEW